MTDILDDLLAYWFITEIEIPIILSAGGIAILVCLKIKDWWDDRK